MKNFIKILKKRSKRLQKHNFQLLEVMIAALLLLICVTPAMRIYTNMYMAQQAIIRENQRDHFAYRIHASIVEQLYKRTIPFNELLTVKENPLNIPILQDELKTWGYEAFYAFIDPKKKKSNKNSEKADKRIFTLVISIKDLKKKPTLNSPESPKKNATSTNFLKEQEDNPAYAQYKFRVYIFTPDSESIKDRPIDEEAVPIEAKDDDDDELDDHEDNIKKKSKSTQAKP